jgi:hypothetical protein
MGHDRDRVSQFMHVIGQEVDTPDSKMDSIGSLLGHPSKPPGILRPRRPS